ncbi:MAG: PQQ-binding-like beta-propeller repeat protein, partial [Planctomycetes bacterium]|nr:PQQ-binding-like beta-propeller repeat protein [Planctomycetota bacterium]
MTFWRSAIVRASIGLLAIAGMAQAAMAAPSATDILDATGVKGGLIVHVGCGDGRLTAALHAGDAFLVHGLDTEAENVEQAREHIRSKGLYGPVSASVFDGRHLPYADDLVNLVVAEDLGEVDKTEVLRVLAPGGVAYIGDGGKWTKTVKPRPDEIDEWTHFLHDASNNAVANDTQVDTPRRLKWTCGPLWTRSHEFNSSVCAMVSAGGRVFYVLDEGLTGITAPPIPERWMLIARDAFNGVLLWKRPLDQWGTGAWRNKALRSIPATVPRSLVAEGDRVFMTLGYGAAVSILDAATGRIVTTCEGTEGASEIRCSDGVLIVRRGTGAITANDAKTGQRLWEVSGSIRPLTPAVCRGKVFFVDGKTLSCLGLKDGKPIWNMPATAVVSLLLVHEDRVV